MIGLLSSIATITGSEITPEVSQYRAEMTAMLGLLDDWSNPALPTNDEEYRALTEIRGNITSLSCYTFNNSLPENDRVWELESVYGRLQERYNRRYRLKDSINKNLARYMILSRFFTQPSRATCFLEARDRGLLRKSQTGSLFVVGLHCKTGNNVFTVDRRGREHRTYVSHIGRQAIGVEQKLPFEGDHRDTFLATVPLMEPECRDVYVFDSKGGIRAPAMRQKEMNNIYQMLIQSSHETSPRIGVQPVESIAPINAPEIHQAQLFEAAA